MDKPNLIVANAINVNSEWRQKTAHKTAIKMKKPDVGKFSAWNWNSGSSEFSINYQRTTEGQKRTEKIISFGDFSE